MPDTLKFRRKPAASIEPKPSPVRRDRYRDLTLLTQDQVAEMWGCTRARVQQIEKEALRKLRDGLQDGTT